jgi:hypothetical protein
MKFPLAYDATTSREDFVRLLRLATGGEAFHLKSASYGSSATASRSNSTALTKPPRMHSCGALRFATSAVVADKSRRW